MTHFIAIADWTIDQLRHALDVSKRLKRQLKETGRNDPILAGKTLAMIFEKPSLRTRVSFAVAMTQLGGSGLLLRGEEVGIGTREPIQDMARVLSSMCDGIMARTFEHEKVTGLARWSTVPVINGLTDYNHPCQAMADVMTLEEHFGNLAGRTMAFIGDGNNVARSLSMACGRLGMKFILAAPGGYEFSADEVAQIRGRIPELDMQLTTDPREAVRNADAIVTDTWVSMGQELEKASRVKAFAGFQVDEKLLAVAPKHAVVLHCLPAYRGLEISEVVLEGPQSLIFPEAENRLHFQKGLLAVLLGGQ
ncbi:MAG TPA: ornithine carbamoyltransferase [Tepidisphaeraceae bacterium]|jgi:ornithine carbamoyltransferase